MNSFWIVALAIAIVLVIAVIAFARSHERWLERQSPIGTWTGQTQSGKVTIAFEGGPHEGTYRQITEAPGQGIREFGSWVQHKRQLQLLMLASDIPGNALLGVDSANRISFVGPQRIQIDGPERLGVRYERLSEGATIDFGEEPAKSH